MELDRIEKLLEKYFEAETSLAEEERLREFFTAQDVPEHLQQHTALFAHLAQSKEERSVRPQALPKNKGHYGWAAAVAAVVLATGLYFNGAQEREAHLEATYTAAEIASAKEAFALLAINFNKGTEQLHHLREFEESTQKFLPKDQ
ncbi:hypothetical protein [Maribacter sp. 2307ULW6-5]|uniref:hypothetical protein n=1 Tax=Maribacter sp. 2307ULW6-5 TaxID=3386275 RepID=UPI0039BC6C24